MSVDLPQNYKLIKEEWAIALMEKGVIVNISFSGWCGWSSLNPQELGIIASSEEFDGWMRKNMRLGVKRILPNELEREITRIKFKISQNLKNNSYNTSWGSFVPYNCFEDWLTNHEKYVDLYKKIGSRFADQRDTIINYVNTEYEVLGRNLWKNVYGKNSDPTDSWMHNFLEQMLKKIPDAEKLIGSYKVKTTFFKIPLPSVLQEDLAKADKIYQNRNKAEHEHALALQAKSAIKEHYVKQKKDLIDDFLMSTMKVLNDQIIEHCNKILSSLKNFREDGTLASKVSHHDITNSHLKKIHSLINLVEKMDIFENVEIRNNMDILRGEVLKFKSQIDTQKICIVLEETKMQVDRILNESGLNSSIEYLDI